MNTFTSFEFTAYIGIDWADTKHDICIQPAGSDRREFDRIAQQPKDIERWAFSMYKRFVGPIAVAIELSKGPIVSALQKYDFFVLFPVNPSMLAKYREAFKPSRAKDDPTDAEFAVDLVWRHRERFKPTIAELAPTLPDYEVFSSLPGAGSVFIPRLLVAFGEDRERFQSAAEVQRYSGVAPVTQRSGNTSWVHWRWACLNIVRQTFVEWAEKTVYRSFWAGAYYRQQRNKGAAHHVAVRALAFKWIRILYRCWQNRRPYDESA